jgi:hypothetical protein
MRAMLAVAAVAAIVAATAHAAASTRFVSKMYGYSFVLPGQWTLSRPASMRWQGGPTYSDSPEVDYYESGDGRDLRVGAMSVPRSSTLRKWTRQFVASYPRAALGCTTPRAYRASTVGGAPALTYEGRCLSSAHDFLNTITIHRGRVYVLAMTAPLGKYSAASNRRVLEAAGKSFRFAR